jgi:hypothetical protein
MIAPGFVARLDARLSNLGVCSRRCGCEPSHRGVLGHAHISPNMHAPCVLALLGSQPI